MPSRRYGLLLAVLVFHSPTDSALGQFGPGFEDREILTLRERLNVLNLLNGLSLDVSQLRDLVRMHRDVEEIRKIHEEQYESVRERFEPQLRALYEKVEAGERLTMDFYLSMRGLDGEMKESRNGYLTDLKMFDEQIRHRLSPQQLRIVEEHAFCLVPAPSIQDPERIGQAGDNTPTRQLIWSVRRMPMEQWLSQKRGLALGLIEAVEADFGLLSDSEKALITVKFTEILERARTLPGAQFMLAVKDMAYDLYSENIDRALKLAIESSNRSMIGGLSKAGTLLLSPWLKPILEERLSRAQSAEVSSGPSLLLSGPKAETCTTRGCALKPEQLVAREGGSEIEPTQGSEIVQTEVKNP